MALTEALAIPALQRFTLAILRFFIGQKMSQNAVLLRRYSIPEAVVGGCGGRGLPLRVEFDLGVRDMPWHSPSW